MDLPSNLQCIHLYYDYSHNKMVVVITAAYYYHHIQNIFCTMLPHLL
jgi:hypothetical protein